MCFKRALNLKTNPQRQMSSLHFFFVCLIYRAIINWVFIFSLFFSSFISTSFALFRLFSVNVLLWFFGHNRAMLQHCLSAPNAHCCRHTQTVHGAQRHRRAFFTRWSNMDCTNVKMPFYFLFHYRHSATQTTTATTHNTISACCCETICTNATINHTQMSILCAEWKMLNRWSRRLRLQYMSSCYQLR